MARPRKTAAEESLPEEPAGPVESTEPTEKERLLELYQTLKELNIRSISDLENLIARA